MTAQFSEKILYQGKEIYLLTLPLDDYFTLLGAKPQFKPDSTALIRGYLGSWKIEDGILWLVALDAKLKDGSDCHLSTLFPTSCGPVRADWFSGMLRIPQGKLLEYVHSGFKNIYEHDLLIEIDKSSVVRAHMRSNTRSDGSTRPWFEP